MEYITFGTKTINPELLKKVLPYPNSYYTKPYGGLWFTKNIELNANDWLYYLSERDSLFFAKFNGLAAVIRLKDNAKILYINTTEDFTKLYNKYPYPYTHFRILDYQKLSQDYDGIYFDQRVLTEIKHNDWCISTLNLFTTDVIEKYKPITVDYVSLPYDKEFYIKNEGNYSNIAPINAKYLLLYDLLKEEFENTYELINDSDIDIYYHNLFYQIYNFIKNNIFKYNGLIEEILSDESFDKNDEKLKEKFVFTLVHNLLADSFEKYKPNGELNYPRRLINSKKLYL